jgi:hypothetical protein
MKITGSDMTESVNTETVKIENASNWPSQSTSTTFKRAQSVLLKLAEHSSDENVRLQAASTLLFLYRNR